MPKRLSHSRLQMTLFALVLLIAAGCRAVEAEPTPSPTEVVATAEAVVEEVIASYPIASTAWDLEYFGPPEVPYPLLPDTRATVAYFWDRYAGFDGCNWFLGVYEADADGFLRNFTPSQTLNYCEPAAVNDQGSLFVTSLLNVTEYELEGEQLIENTVDDQRLLTLNPAELRPMPNTLWQLKFWWAAEAEQWAPALPLSASNIVFSEDGEATGSGGCNDFRAEYTGDLQLVVAMESTSTSAELPSLVIGPITYDPTVCEEPEGIMEQEQGFLAALGLVAQYYRLGGMLLLLDASGDPIMLLGAQD